MRDKLFENNNLCNVQGTVQIDYTDPLTGKTKERIRSKNHAFQQTAMGRNILFAIRNGRYNLTLTDFQGTLDTGIPVLPGHFLGYGYPGSQISGKYRGMEHDELRFDGTSNGTNRVLRYTYEWLPTQISGEIGAIGFVNSPVNSAYMYDMNYYQPYTIEANCPESHMYVDEHKRAYSKDGFNVLVNGIGSISLSEPASEDRPHEYSSRTYTNVGYDMTTGDMWFVVRWQTESSSLDKFLDFYQYDKGFTTLKQKYRLHIDRYVSINSKAHFFIKNGHAFFITFNDSSCLEIRKVDITPQSGLIELSSIETVISSSGFNGDGKYDSRDGYCSFAGKYAFITGVYGGDGDYRTTFVFNTETDQIYASVFNKVEGFGSTHIWLPNARMKTIQGLPLIIGVEDQEYKTLCSALTCYKVPPDAPKRPAGTGVSVTYELEIDY